uniref:Uncharacterized protein n=1 Tax=Anguilla anguilla TaxID=7936 RepID=A0A0E9PRE5_ANGAN
MRPVLSKDEKNTHKGYSAQSNVTFFQSNYVREFVTSSTLANVFE